MAIDYSNYIHEFEENGKIYYAVAEWDEQHNEWITPMNAEEHRLTGAHTYFSRRVENAGFITRDRNKARYQARCRFMNDARD